MLNDIKNALILRRFWIFDAWLDVVIRHRNSVLGILWNLLPTVVFVALVGTVFQRVLNEDISFYFYLTCGLVIWAPINQILSGSPECYQKNRSFILVGGLSLIIFNAKLLFQAVFQFVIQLALIIAAIFIFRPDITSELAYSLLAFLLLLAFLFPLSIILGIIGARFKDFAEAFKSFVRVLFLSTPIIWSIGNESRFERVQIFLSVNPFFFAMELIRAPILGLPINHDYWPWLIGYTVGAWVLAVFVYSRFSKTTALWLQ